MAGSDYDDMTWIVCDCHGDALAVWHDPDDDLTWIEFWTSGTGAPKWGWRQRLRFAWLWLRGKPETMWGVVLKTSEAERLAAILLAHPNLKAGVD